MNQDCSVKSVNWSVRYYFPFMSIFTGSILSNSYYICFVYFCRFLIPVVFITKCLKKTSADLEDSYFFHF